MSLSLKKTDAPRIEHPSSVAIEALSATVDLPIADDYGARHARVMERLRAVDPQKLAYAEMAAAVALGATFADMSLSVPELERIASIAETNAVPRLRPPEEFAQ